MSRTALLILVLLAVSVQAQEPTKRTAEECWNLMHDELVQYSMNRFETYFPDCRDYKFAPGGADHEVVLRWERSRGRTHLADLGDTVIWNLGEGSVARTTMSTGLMPTFEDESGKSAGVAITQSTWDAWNTKAGLRLSADGEYLTLGETPAVIYADPWDFTAPAPPGYCKRCWAKGEAVLRVEGCTTTLMGCSPVGSNCNETTCVTSCMYGHEEEK